jgi:hypothetical protein
VRNGLGTFSLCESNIAKLAYAAVLTEFNDTSRLSHDRAKVFCFFSPNRHVRIKIEIVRSGL